MNETAYCEVDHKKKKVPAGIFRKDLPTFTEKDLKEHGKTASQIWVAYKEGVYDITEFAKAHPGGDKILMAAGNSIEAFWQVYPVHYKSETFAILEKYRIGNLKLDESSKLVDLNDPFAKEPKRHPLLKVLTLKPFNAETPKELSVEHVITPNDLHFVRNHLPVPVIVDASKFELEIENTATNIKYKFKLNDLKEKFPVYTIPVTLQCSGNKRKFMNEYEPVQGLMWDVNGISTANWTGVKLKDVLDYCKIDMNDENLVHVQFEGLDKDPTGSKYGASIPKEKVVNEFGDVLLAFKMNNVDIPPDHGYPLRVIVPGVTGARSVKWLSKIILSKSESSSHWQQNDYKLISPSIKNIKEADFSQYKAIQETAVQSAICEPVDGAKIDREDSSFTVKGYAFSGGGNAIRNVYVSIDNGKSWKMAELKRADTDKYKSKEYRNWSWVIWECDVDMPKDISNLKSLEIVCAAVDSNQNTQPETVKQIWNIRGLVNNSWHRVKVELS